MGKVSQIEKVLAKLRAKREVVDTAIKEIEAEIVGQAKKPKPTPARQVKRSNAAEKAVASWESEVPRHQLVESEPA